MAEASKDGIARQVAISVVGDRSLVVVGQAGPRWRIFRSIYRQPS